MKMCKICRVRIYLSCFIFLFAISELRAQPRNGQVRLGWNPPVDENNQPFRDFDFYRLYICNQELKKQGEKVQCPGGTLSSIEVTKEQQETTIFHSVPTEDTIFVYAVTATTAGDESDLSNRVVIKPSDWIVIEPSDLVSLASSRYMIGASELGPGEVVEHLWDGCTERNRQCSLIAEQSTSVWIEFDFKSPHKLHDARLYGDTDDQRVSHSWSLSYKMEADAPWQPAFDRESAVVDDWVQQDLEDIAARYVRVEIFGKPTGVQARELEIHGRTVLDETPTIPLITLPGTVQAENYRLGGEGVGYHDTTKGNEGDVYRRDDVDIRRLKDDNYAISWTEDGEWLAYRVEVLQSASFSIGLYYATAPGATQVIVSFLVDNLIIVKRASLPNTGSETKFIPVPLGTIALLDGRHEIKLVVEQGQVDLDKIVLNKILQ